MGRVFGSLRPFVAERSVLSTLAALLRYVGAEVKRRKGEALDPDKTLKKPKGFDTSTIYKVNFFVGGGSNGKITMAEEMAQGKMSAAQMQPILTKLPGAIAKAWPNRPVPRKGWNLFQDNDTGQNAACLQSEYKKHKLNNFKAPGNSGDLRHYELWWKPMRLTLLKTDPGRGETLEEFKARVKKTILRTSKKEIGDTASSMPRRLEDRYQNGGGRVRG